MEPEQLTMRDVVAALDALRIKYRPRAEAAKALLATLGDDGGGQLMGDCQRVIAYLGWCEDAYRMAHEWPDEMTIDVAISSIEDKMAVLKAKRDRLDTLKDYIKNIAR